MSRLDEVEATWDHWGCGRTSTEVCGLALEQARTLAAEVDARDEVITKLLDSIKPTTEDDRLREFSNAACDRYGFKQSAYRRACEIAGRTE